ncbi:hypothetical protein [Pseudomonas oryzihabitans]|uniref:hypothetical protein n=1 Tax=Pseudomonas oryzihabitans TaxID=47885 RepID=UPI0011A4B292|nr:hypothetical protein [Pseudomonas oryzihabitans]
MKTGPCSASRRDFGKTVLYEEFILYGERLPDIEGGDFEVSQFTSPAPLYQRNLGLLGSADRSSTVKLVAHYGEDAIDLLERSPDLIGDAGIPPLVTSSACSTA